MTEEQKAGLRAAEEFLCGAADERAARSGNVWQVEYWFSQDILPSAGVTRLRR